MLPSKPMTRRLFSIAALSSLSLTIGCASKPTQATCADPAAAQTAPATSSLIAWQFNESVIIHLMENMAASPEDSKSIRKIIQSSDDTEETPQMTAIAISPKTITALQRLLKEYPETVGEPHDLSVKPETKEGTIVTGLAVARRGDKIYVAYSQLNPVTIFPNGAECKKKSDFAFVCDPVGFYLPSVHSTNLELPFTGGVLMRTQTGHDHNSIPLGNGTEWVLIVPK